MSMSCNPLAEIVIRSAAQSDAGLENPERALTRRSNTLPDYDIRMTKKLIPLERAISNWEGRGKAPLTMKQRSWLELHAAQLLKTFSRKLLIQLTEEAALPWTNPARSFRHFKPFGAVHFGKLFDSPRPFGPFHTESI
jgi:hypothetical protein